LDKFGLARLLGQVRATEDKPLPPSAFGQNGGVAKRGSMSRPSTSAGETKTDKKSKRTTMQLVSERYVSLLPVYYTLADPQTIYLSRFQTHGIGQINRLWATIASRPQSDNQPKSRTCSSNGERDAGPSSSWPFFSFRRHCRCQVCSTDCSCEREQKRFKWSS
jgi:hypothetical protein